MAGVISGALLYIREDLVYIARPHDFVVAFSLLIIVSAVWELLT